MPEHVKRVLLGPQGRPVNRRRSQRDVFERFRAARHQAAKELGPVTKPKLRDPPIVLAALHVAQDSADVAALRLAAAQRIEGLPKVVVKNLRRAELKARNAANLALAIHRDLLRALTNTVGRVDP